MNSTRVEIIQELVDRVANARSHKDLDDAVVFRFDKFRLDGCDFIIPDIHDYVLDNFSKRNDPEFIEDCIESLLYLYVSEIWRDV